MKKLLSIIFFSAFLFPVQAQHLLKIVPLDKDTFFFKKIFPLQMPYANELEKEQQLQDALFKLYANGFLAASFDSIIVDSLTDVTGFSNRSRLRTTAFLTTGSVYKWMELSSSNIDEGALSSAGFRKKLYSGKTFSYKNIRKLQERLLAYAENNGCPFAVVKLDSVAVDKEKISAKILLVKNQQITIDSIHIEGNAKITRRYLENYLGIKAGDFYNEAVIKKISPRIKSLPFLQEEKPMNISFLQDKARINLFLKNKKASRFNFLIGFLPNNQQTGKLLVTGDAMLNLQNSLGGGEVILLNWKKYQALSQNLNIKFLYPYLPLLPFGFDFNFELYKKDTAYLDLVRDFGLQYSFTGGNYLKAFYHNKKSTLLTVDTIRILASHTLPQNLDITFNMYGLEYRLEKLDYRYNPKKGFDFKITAGAGVKKIKRNSAIEKLEDPAAADFSFSSLYDSLKLSSVQYQGNYFFNWYFPVSARTVIKAGATGGAIVADEIFNNELYRIGGNQLLRGFDEESVFASLYHVATVEYRFLLEQNSYLYLFTDGAYVEKKVKGQETKYDFPFGFGSGITFETKAGIFALSYALGTQQGNPVLLKNAKIHFGYVNYF